MTPAWRDALLDADVRRAVQAAVGLATEHGADRATARTAAATELAAGRCADDAARAALATSPCPGARADLEALWALTRAVRA